MKIVILDGYGANPGDLSWDGLAFGMQVKALTSKAAAALLSGVRKADLAELLATADVMVDEPPRADSPLLRQPNAFFTPHVAWATREARVRLLSIAIDNVRAFAAGHPQNTV